MDEMLQAIVLAHQQNLGRLVDREFVAVLRLPQFLLLRKVRLKPHCVFQV
jgi:hypothetical protein